MIKHNYIGANCQNYQQNQVCYTCRRPLLSCLICPCGAAPRPKNKASAVHEPCNTVEKPQVREIQTAALYGHTLRYCPLWFLLPFRGLWGFPPSTFAPLFDEGRELILVQMQLLESLPPSSETKLHLIFSSCSYMS